MRQQLLDSTGLQAIVDAIAEKIFSSTETTKRLALVGVHTRGVPLAERIGKYLLNKGRTIEIGTVDVILYRDDFSTAGKLSQIKGTEIPFDIDDAEIILCDEVLFTGRTIRAAIDSLMDYGRPSRIRFATLVDRGHRELPIQADFVGMTLETTKDDYVEVRFHETDPEEGVWKIEVSGSKFQVPSSKPESQAVIIREIRISLKPET